MNDRLDCDALLGLKPEPEYSEDTIYDYLIDIIVKDWHNRPREWSSADWDHPFSPESLQTLYCPLIEAGLVEGEIDYKGEPRDVDTKTADVLIGALIEYLASGYSPRYGTEEAS